MPASANAWGGAAGAGGGASGGQDSNLRQPLSANKGKTSTSTSANTTTSSKQIGSARSTTNRHNSYSNATAASTNRIRANHQPHPHQRARMLTTTHLPPGATSRRRGRQPHLDPEARKKLAQARWKKAIRRVKAMVLFQMKFDFSEDEDQEPVNLAPTYKMLPDPGKKVNSTQVERLIITVLTDRLQEYEYSRYTAPKFAKVLSNLLLDRMKELDFPRYKYVINVLITENRKQGLKVTSRCVWDQDSDQHATGQYTRATFIAVVSIHGIYLE